MQRAFRTIRLKKRTIGKHEESDARGCVIHEDMISNGRSYLLMIKELEKTRERIWGERPGALEKRYSLGDLSGVCLRQITQRYYAMVSGGPINKRFLDLPDQLIWRGLRTTERIQGLTLITLIGGVMEYTRYATHELTKSELLMCFVQNEIRK